MQDNIITRGGECVVPILGNYFANFCIRSTSLTESFLKVLPWYAVLREAWQNLLLQIYSLTDDSADNWQKILCLSLFFVTL